MILVHVKFKMNIEEFGKVYWKEMLAFAHTANTYAEKQAFRIWIYNLAKRFPCDRCRPHFISYVEKNPPENSLDPIIWVVQFHNAVNKRLGKPVLSMKQALQKYNENFNDCKNCKLS